MDTDFKQRLELAFADAMEAQGVTARRKNTIASITGGILQIANLTTGLTTEMPWWGTAILAIVLMVAEAIFHATSEGAVTPSVQRKVLTAAADRTLEAAAEETTPPPTIAVPVRPFLDWDQATPLRTDDTDMEAPPGHWEAHGRG